MDTTEKSMLYKKSMQTWGEESQFKMLAEECCELAQVALKYHRKFNHSTLSQLVSELADVEIMIEQIKQHVHMEEEVDIEKSFKLKRLEGILAGR
jgi:NTP pyrophosphatase (non-canonical NTP hydrolase)